MIPTINDYPSDVIYTDEQRKYEIYNKYFPKVGKIMSVNEAMIKIEKNYLAVADIAAKTFLAYAIIDCDMKIKTLYDELKPIWEKYHIKFSRRRFTELLKNVYIKTVNEQIKIAVLSAVIDTAFHHDDIYKYVIARMTADGKTGLIKVLHNMQQRFIASQPKDKIYRYLKPTRPSEAQGRANRYRQAEVKNKPEKGYEYGAVEGSYKWNENEPYKDKMDAVTRYRKRTK